MLERSRRMRVFGSLAVAVVTTVSGFGALVMGIHSPSPLQHLVQAFGLPVFTLLDSSGLLVNTLVMWTAILAGTAAWWAVAFFIGHLLVRSPA